MLDQFRRGFMSVPTFVRRANTAVEGASAEHFRSRSGELKGLIEEVLPLATFLKHLEIPSRRVTARLSSDDADHDAQIKVAGPEVDRGFLRAHYFVEITTAASPVEYLRREALNRNGFAFGGSDIRREGSRFRGDDRIISKAVAVDGEAAARDATTWGKDRIEAKSRKHYPTPCILLINVEPEKRLTLGEWYALTSSSTSIVQPGVFSSIYVIDWQAPAAHAIGPG
jgi:hypothetical protein